MKIPLEVLQDRIHDAIGSDRVLDAEIAQLLQGDTGSPPNFTGSVDACLNLLFDVLPGWHWHVGHGANGILPYATVSKDRTIIEADGTTVPLVLLTAMIKALLQQGRT